MKKSFLALSLALLAALCVLLAACSEEKTPEKQDGDNDEIRTIYQMVRDDLSRANGVVFVATRTQDGETLTSRYVVEGDVKSNATVRFTSEKLCLFDLSDQGAEAPAERKTTLSGSVVVEGGVVASSMGDELDAELNSLAFDVRFDEANLTESSDKNGRFVAKVAKTAEFCDKTAENMTVQVDYVGEKIVAFVVRYEMGGTAVEAELSFEEAGK